jgi:hypothetical protein
VSLKDEKVLRVAHRPFAMNMALLLSYSIDLWLRTQSGKAFIGRFTFTPFLLALFCSLCRVGEVENWSLRTALRLTSKTPIRISDFLLAV